MGFTTGTKFNADTDFEFTISNETIADMVAGDTGITEGDIAAYCYTSFIDKRVAALVPESTRNTNDGLYPWSQEYCPVYNTNQGQHPSALKMNVDVLNDKKVTCYERNVLTYYGTVNNKTGHFLVMDIKDIKKWVIDCDASGAFGSGNVTSTAGFNGINGTIYLYDTNHVPQINPINAPAGTTGGLYPCNIVNIDSTLWIGFFTPIAHSKNLICNERLSHAAWEFDYSAGDTFNVNSSGYVYQGDNVAIQGWCDFSDLEFPTSNGQTTQFNTYIDVDDFNIIRITGQYGNSQNAFITNCEMGNMFKSLKALHTVQSWAGLLFYDNGVLYKPIITGGVVTGFTSDMDIPSEWDNMTNVTGNNISPTPPTPAGGDNENEEIEMPLAYIGGTGGFVQFIKINSAGLASADDISAALSRFDITTIGKDLLRNFISYKCFAVLNIDPDNTVTRQIKVDGHGLEDENGNPLEGQIIGGLLPIDFTIGTAPRYFDDFRDYAPYTKLEAYVPFCGWFTLPSWCIGLPITGTMFTDLYNGTVKAVIYASDTVVAEVGGCCAYDIPFVADATGSKAGAVISSALSTAAATAATVTMPNVATGIAAVTSAANTICAANSNDTTLKGVMGDGSNLNGLLHCYLKITRPQSPTRNKVIPNTYKHEFGIPTYKELTLASGDGFTQVNDANITGNMTAAEKQMIIDGFKHGLIL